MARGRAKEIGTAAASAPQADQAPRAALPPDQQRRLACLALAVESRAGGDPADALVQRARVYDSYVRGNPYTEHGPSDD